MRYWYFVADGARGRLFKSKKLDGELEETDNYVNEEGRLANREFDRDRPGRSRGRGTLGAWSSATTPFGRCNRGTARRRRRR